MLRTTRGEPADDRLLFLLDLIDGDADVAPDIAEVPGDTWAIHGLIPIDRDVIMAEFDTYEQARSVLDQLLHGRA